MTAEIKDCNGAPECSKVEMEEKSGSNSSPRGDLVNACECNGIAHENVEEVDGAGKDDTDGSYEFVNGDDDGERDRDADCVVDPVKSAKSNAYPEENGPAEPGNEEKKVGGEELREEKVDNGITFGANSCAAECVVSSSNSDVEIDGSPEEPNVVEIKVNGTVDGGEKQLELGGEPEKSEECESTDVEGVESDLQPVENGKEVLGAELDQTDNGKNTEDEEVADESDLHRVENAREVVGAELDRIENGKDPAAAEVSNDVPAGGPVSGEQGSGVADSAVTETKLEADVRNSAVESEELDREEGNDSLTSNELEVQGNGGIEDEDRKNCVETVGVETKVVENRDIEVEPPKDSKVLPTCPVGDINPETEDMGREIEVRNGSIQSSQAAAMCSVGATGLETENTNGSDENGHSLGGLPMCPEDDSECRPGVEGASAEAGENVTTGPVDHSKSENEIRDDSIRSSNIPIDDKELQAEVRSDSVQNTESLPTCSTDDPELKAEAENNSVESGEDVSITDVVHMKLETEGGDSIESKPDGVTIVPDVEDGDQTTNKDDGDKAVHEDVVAVEEIASDGILPSSEKETSAAALDAPKAEAEVGRKVFNFMIRIPRYVDDKIRTQIRLAQLQVDEKTQSRDSIRVAMQQKKATSSEYREKFQAAKLEERAARDALNAKRQEIDSVQSMINMMKNATSVDDIDERIHNIKHMMEHETMHLKEEKQLLREIKQLKQAREQLSANMGTQTEIQEAFDQRDGIEERLKILKQELSSLRNEVLRAESISNAAKKSNDDEFKILKELQSQFKSADDLRQEAYAHLQSLKKQMYEKNKYFRMYKEDQNAAANYLSAGDKEALQSFCSNQVEKIMELWNKNDEFRKEYIQNNMFSTVRRLKTLDGRSLGPDEEPPVLRNPAEEKIDNARLTSANMNTALPSSSESVQEKPRTASPKKADIKPAIDTAQKKPSVQSKKAGKPTSAETILATVSSRVDVEEESEIEKKQRKEEEELARKEEELRKAEAAAKLKEQRQLEEKAKAKEAEERKRRNADKAKARAEFKAQKEAELKEKEREKKARKKERMKAASKDITNGVNDAESAPVSENSPAKTSQEPKIKEKPETTVRKSVKSVAAAKQMKTKPVVPLPLRNKGKRRTQPWMWVLLTAVLLLALILVGNGSASFNFSLGF